MHITQTRIENILSLKLDSESIEQLTNADLQYDELSQKEMETYLIHYIDVLTADITQSGEHRINEWERGWNENLENFNKTGNIDELIPKYHGKKRFVRWHGRMVNPHKPDFDYKLHMLIVDAILKKYMNNVDNIFEFGCGPAYHLLRLQKYFPNKKLFGADWTVASQQVIKNINSVFKTDITGFNFNFFTPNYDIDIPKNSGIYTVAALEQVGEKFKDFVEFLIKKNPTICVHFEPIDELLDNTCLLDNLTIKYFRKRRYLNGFLPYLRELQMQGKIEILDERRTYTGSYFIEGHSLVVWKPVK
jgi:hypothetical protein